MHHTSGHEEARERYEQACVALLKPECYWRMGDGQTIRISAMTDKHIWYAVRFARRNSGATEEQLQEWLPFQGLLKEAKKRKLNLNEAR